MSGSVLRSLIAATRENWEALAPDWDALLRDVDGQTALQSPAFLSCWWRHFGAEMTPWLVAVYEGDRLIGLAPLQLAKRRLWKRTYRVLEFMGMPDELDRPMLLVRTGDMVTLEVLLEAIAQRRADWDLIQLDELERDSWVIPALEQWSRRHGLWFHRRDFHPCPYLEKGSATWEEYLRSKSKRFGKRLRSGRRRLEKEGVVRYEISAERGEAATMIDTFFEIEQKSWKADGGVAAGSDPRYRQFCRDLMAAPNGGYTGHVIIQRLDERPIAATFGLSCNHVYYSLQIAHDKAFDALSPGTMLEAFEMEWFFRNPTLRRYEFLGGDVLNKRRWTDTAVATSKVFIRRPGLHIALKDLSRFYVRPLLGETKDYAQTLLHRIGGGPGLALRSKPEIWKDSAE